MKCEKIEEKDGREECKACVVESKREYRCGRKKIKNKARWQEERTYDRNEELCDLKRMEEVEESEEKGKAYKKQKKKQRVEREWQMIETKEDNKIV